MNKITKENLAEIFDPERLTFIDSTTLRTEVRDVLEDVRFRKSHKVILTFGRIMGVMVGPEDYDQVMEFLGRPKLMETFSQRDPKE